MTRQQSINLFPTRGHNSSRIKANHKENLRDISNLFSLLDPIPLSYMISIIYSLPSTSSITLQNVFAVFSINNLVARLPSMQLIATFSDVKERLISLIRTVTYVLAGTLYLLAGTLSILLGPLFLLIICLCSYILSTAATFHVGLAAVWKSVTCLPAYLINCSSSIIVDKGSCGKMDEIYLAETYSSELNPTHTGTFLFNSILILSSIFVLFFIT
jgi:hypothetical protein